MTINEFLLELGISPELKGFEYIKRFLQIRDLSRYKLMECYELIGKACKTKSASVERSIRHVVELSFEHIPENYKRKIFGNIYLKDGKPTNKTFLYCLKLYYEKQGKNIVE